MQAHQIGAGRTCIFPARGRGGIDSDGRCHRAGHVPQGVASPMGLHRRAAAAASVQRVDRPVGVV